MRGWACRTNIPSNTAFRGFGGPQGMMVMEEIIAAVSSRLGLDDHTVSSSTILVLQNYCTGSGHMSHSCPWSWLFPDHIDQIQNQVSCAFIPRV